jgi:hypothetical protein
MLFKLKLTKDVFIFCVVFSFFSAMPMLLADEPNVLLYEKSNYGGQHIKITTSVPDLSQSPYFFNDILSSVKLVSISSIAVFENANYTGWCETITRDVNNFGDLDIDHDTVSSIKLNAVCPGGPAVILYEKDNFKGKKVKVFGSAGDLSNAAYNINDQVSSFKLVDGASSVALFEHANYGGNCQAFTSDQSKLKDTNIGNDMVSSVKLNGECNVSGPHVILYEDNNFGGKQLMIKGDKNDLRVNNFNDKISSIKMVNVASIAAYKDPEFKGDCQTFTTDALSMAGSKVGNDKISSIRYNKKCDDYRILTVKNSSATLMRYGFDDGYPNWDRKLLAAGRSDDLNLEPNRPVKVILYLVVPDPNTGNGYTLDEKCRYTLNMGQDVKITFKGTMFKTWCENSLMQ